MVFFSAIFPLSMMSRMLLWSCSEIWSLVMTGSDGLRVLRPTWSHGSFSISFRVIRLVGSRTSIREIRLENKMRRDVKQQLNHNEVTIKLYFQTLSFVSLKALFNNVFTLKNLSCMSLHAISVFDKV